MCGIWGFSLKTNANRRMALQKFKILGLYNKSRGRDASGVFVNGEIFKGIGKVSEFDDFIEDTIIPIPKENGIMLGHARQGSVGYKKTIDEAHPFLINDDMVFTHNGTIKNIVELCDKYRVDKERFTVDSQALGAIIEEDGYNILDEYKGYAALAFTKLSEPNILMLYHGASKEYKLGSLQEERPLFYMETKDGVYYSSMEESLKAIRENENEEPVSLKHNRVYRIENGKFNLDRIANVSREEMNVTVYTNTNINSSVGKRHHIPMHTRTYGTTNYYNNSNVGVIDEMLVKRESLPIKLVEAKDRSGFIYYHWGRYWEAPRKLMQGPVYIKKGSWITDGNDTSGEMEYFWQGVLLKNKEAFTDLIRLRDYGVGDNFAKSPASFNYAMYMSRFSKYAITNIFMEAATAGDNFRNDWYKNNATVINDTFTPKYGNGRNYKIKDGKLVEITVSQREKPLMDSYAKATEQIKDLIDGTLLSGTPGGSTHQLPFLSPVIQGALTIDESIRSNEGEYTTKGTKEEEDESTWWFDIPFLSRNFGESAIGDLEKEALREFVSQVCQNDFNLTPIDAEIEDEIERMIQMATDQQCSILDTINPQMDKQLLMHMYEEAIARERRREEMRAAFNAKEEVDLLNQIDEENMTREEVLENIETSINEMEEAQETAFALLDAQDDDLAQEIAGALISGAMGTLANYESILSRHGETELVNRVKKVREIKAMADGTL